MDRAFLDGLRVLDQNGTLRTFNNVVQNDKAVLAQLNPFDMFQILIHDNVGNFAQLLAITGTYNRHTNYLFYIHGKDSLCFFHAAQ